MRRLPLSALVMACVTSLAGGALAEQVIVTDVSYTHSAATTTDSHYFVSPSPATPSNWTSPVDYTKGSVYFRLEVKTKPTDTPTRYQVCFDVLPEYGCAWQVEPYTAPGVYEFTMPFSQMWYPTTEHDWSRGVRTLSLILKDVNNGKPQGDARYVPTDLRVVVALLSEGAVFVPPSTPDSGVPPVDAGGSATEAGVRDGGAVRDASAVDSSVEPPPPSGGRDSGIVTPPDEAGPPRGSGGTPTRPPARSGGAGGADGGATSPGGPDGLELGGRGCAVPAGAAPGAPGSALFAAAAVLLSVRRRRQRDARSRSSAA